MGTPKKGSTTPAAPKNRGRAGMGRPKGSVNKTTRDFRETVTRVLEGNSENVGKWLKAVAEGDKKAGRAADPGKALDLMSKLAEYAAPKLARTELVGDPDKPLVPTKSMTDDDLIALIAKVSGGGK